MPSIITTPTVTGSEIIVLDPGEVATGRVEVDITNWISAEGPNWGDAEIEQYMAEAQRGQIPVDFRFPNRRVEIPLLLRESVATSYETMRAALQAKVALFQAEGGWLKRETNIGPVFMDIVGATLHLSGDVWQAFHARDTDAVLTLETIPDYYGLDEITSATEGTGYVIKVLEGVIGHYPGRVRIIVTDTSGNDQHGLVYGIRGRNYDPAASAALTFEAENLDPASGTTIAFGRVVRANISTSWTPLLGTNIGGTTFLTHKGSYRVWARLSSNVGATQPQVRFVYDIGDLVLPAENDPVTIPGFNQDYWMDMGEIRLDRAPLGNHRWRGLFQAKGAVGGESARIDKVHFQPLDETAGRVQSSIDYVTGLSSQGAWDEFNQSAGALAGKALPSGGTWSGDGDGDDFTVEATGHTAQRTATSDSDLAGRLAIAGTTTFTNVAAQVDFKRSASHGDTLVQGLILRYTADDEALYVYVYEQTLGKWSWGIVRRTPGADVFYAGDTTITATAGSWYTLAATVLDSGQCIVKLGPRGGVQSQVTTITDGELASGGDLASGKAGLYDEMNVTTAVTRSYDNFLVAEPSRDAVIYANQSVEVRTEGVFREDSSGVDAYGHLTPSGSLPRLPAAGLEDRIAEVYVKWSRGDLDTFPDPTADEGTVEVLYRPSWLFVATA